MSKPSIIRTWAERISPFGYCEFPRFPGVSFSSIDQARSKRIFTKLSDIIQELFVYLLSTTDLSSLEGYHQEPFAGTFLSKLCPCNASQIHDRVSHGSQVPSPQRKAFFFFLTPPMLALDSPFNTLNTSSSNNLASLSFACGS